MHKCSYVHWVFWIIVDFQNGNNNLHTDWANPHTVLKHKTDGVNSGYCPLFFLKLVQLPACHWKHINSPTTFSIFALRFILLIKNPSEQTALLTTRFVLLPSLQNRLLYSPHVSSSLSRKPSEQTHFCLPASPMHSMLMSVQSEADWQPLAGPQQTQQDYR